MNAVEITCPDCGPHRANHASKRMFIAFDWLAAPYLKVFESLGRSVSIFFGVKSSDSLATLFTRALLGLGVFSRALAPKDEDTIRTKVAWQEANRRGISMAKLTFLGSPTSMFTATYGGQTIVFEGLPRPEGDFESLKWLDNKAVIREKFAALGLPVAAGGKAFTFKKAKEIFHRIGAPVVVKPHLGSRSQHTTIHINNEAELFTAFQKAKQLSPWVIVEKQLDGMNHRATMIGGKVFAVIRREQPHVVGDGSSTISQLMERENKNPKRDGSYFYALPKDAQAVEELRRQDLAWGSIPAKDQIVYLNQKAVGYLGSGLTDLTDMVHPENIKLFEKIDKILGVPLHGIDFMTSDISKPWQETVNSGIIECNSLPFIEMHHFPLAGNPRDAMGALWDLVFPDSKQKVSE